MPWGRRWRGEGNGSKAGLVRKQLVLRDTEFKVEYIEELAFDPANITLAKDTGANGPVDVLQSRIVEVLEEWSIIGKAMEKRSVRTLDARIRDPKKTRSMAHSSSAMCR